MMGWTRSCRWLLALALGAAGCGDEEAPAPPPLPDGLDASGTFALVSPFDLTATALAPKQVAGFVGALGGLKSDPAGTFFALLDEAGVPLAGDLLAALPDTLSGKVKGWMNEAIRERVFEGRPVSSEIDVILQQANTVLLRFDLLTTLAVPPPPADKAPHTVRGIGYRLYGDTVEVIIPRIVTDRIGKRGPFVSETDAPLRLSGVVDGEPGDARLALGDHVFGIPYGEYAFAGLDRGAALRYGGGLRMALGRVIDCGAVANDVAKKCLGPVACVGHTSELRAVCERGLDEVVKDVRERMYELDFQAVRLEKGEGALHDRGAPDEAADGKIARIDDGVWKARIDIGMGPRAVPARFTGKRQAE